jgi:hypothetical protein
MKTYWVSRGIARHAIPDVGTRRMCVVSFTLPPFYLRGRSPPPAGIHCIGGWVGTRAGLDAAEKRKFKNSQPPSPGNRTPEPRSSSPQSVAIPTEIHRLPWTLKHFLIKHHAIKTYWGSGGIAPHILKLGTRWWWTVSSTLQSFHLRERKPLVRNG